MDNLPMNIVDLVVVVVLVLSALAGLMRGFVREVLSLAAWVGAAWVALTFYADAEAYVSQYLENKLAISVVAGGSLFVVALIVLMLVARLLASGIKKTALLGPLDRTLGLGFGLLRGAVVLGLAYLLTVQLATETDREPEWVAGSKLLPYVKVAGQVLESLAPARVGRAREVLQRPQDILEGTGYTPEINRQIPNLIESQPSEPDEN